MSGEMLKNFGWTKYGFPERTEIADGDLNQLLRAEIILQALMESGVHNFEGFDAAMERAREMLNA